MAAQFEFSPAPQTDLNRIYRVDRVTGEVGACQYGQKDGSYGVTICYSAGEGPVLRKLPNMASLRHGMNMSRRLSGGLSDGCHEHLLCV